MKLLSFLFCLIVPYLGIAQNTDSARVITLHKITGKVITVEEKKQYDLFPEYKDNMFVSAEVLKYNDTTYTIRFKTTKANTFERPTNTKELDEIYAKIDSKKQNYNYDEVTPTTQDDNNYKKRNRINIDPQDGLAIGLIASRIVIGILILSRW